MGHPAETVTFGVPERSSDGRLYALYPRGDAPNSGGAGQGLGATATANAALGSAIGGSSGGEDNYDYSSYPVTHIVDPERTTDGTGSEGSPLQPSQAMALSTASSYVHCEWLPGVLAVALNGSKYPALSPATGTSTRPVIHRARNPAITASQSDRTRLVRASGEGSFFGAGGAFGGISDVWWDGFESIEYTNNNGNDRFNFSWWGVERVKVVRCRLGNGGGGGSSGDNHGCLWAQDAVVAEIADCIIGNNSGSGENSAAVMFYDVADLDFHHCDISNSPALIFVKGEHTGFDIERVRIFLNKLSGGTYAGLLWSAPTSGTEFGNLNYAVRNDISACARGVWYNAYGAGIPSGIVTANNLIRSCTQAGMLLKPGTAGGYSPLLGVMNNILYANARGIESEDTSWSSHTDFEFDRNGYFGNTTMYREGSSNRNFAYWQALQNHLGQFNDANGRNDDPQFEDAGNGDFRLSDGSPYLGAGVDYLQLLGGASDDPINIGPYISAEQNEVIGVRT